MTTLRLPLLVISPGVALSVGERVEFPTRVEDELSGRLLLTTVRISQPNSLQALGAWLDDDKDVVGRERVIPEGVNAAEYIRGQREVFEQSGQLAAAAGLRAAGEQVSVSGAGAQVLALAPDAPAAGVLPFPVTVDAGDIGGPSAGLLIALTVYDLADEGDLTGGRVIAGTGTIDAQGNVGPVGGVEQKIEAALDAGARIFLSPPDEAEQARAAAGDRLQVIEVATLQEAIAALGGRSPR